MRAYVQQEFDRCRQAGFEERHFWAVPNPIYGYEPVYTPGFKGAYYGRPDDWWLPEVGYSATEKYLFESEREALHEALCRLDQHLNPLLDSRRVLMERIERADSEGGDDES